MKKNKLKILEKAFEAEVNSAFHSGVHLYQAKSKIAKELESEGYLHQRTIIFGSKMPVSITGYELTNRGRIEYCESCN